MIRVPTIDRGSQAGYGQLLTHLLEARAAANQLDDRAAVALIEVLERLCVSRSGAAEGAQATEGAAAALAPISLEVYLLGGFRLYLNGQAVSGWRKKSESLFKFLVCHRGVPVHRDQIIDLFWPEAEPHAARNCLNVTLHGLRRALELPGERGAEGIVQFADDCYRLGDGLQIWCDADAFGQHVARAQAAEHAGDAAGAIAHYELADALYQGDFLRDDRYEEWTVARRERLRTGYMALLGNLGQLYYGAASFVRAIECAQKILERDNCHEEAHRLIMRCYSAMGQRGMALRQYALCRETLDRELGVPPMEETDELAELVRSGQAL
jgi:DNA-binding SARP family transcriptional activator